VPFKNSTSLNITHMRLSVVAVGMAILMCFGYPLAADTDFNKLATIAKQRYGDETYQDIRQLEQLISGLKSASEAEKLAQINLFFNQKIMFTDDVNIWGKTDYWATPLEALGIQAGDCEDYSIAKYMFLKSLGIANEKLRLTYVKAKYMYQGQLTVRAHMVLSYYSTPNAEPLILDNLVPNISSASSRKDLSPIFSFNDQGLWVGNSTKPKADSQTHLSRWRDVLNRMRADGIE
jgi:predicted transglutaminase-like cysteine proteinase